jgi:hypothetical protein
LSIEKKLGYLFERFVRSIDEWVVFLILLIYEAREEEVEVAEHECEDEDDVAFQDEFADVN